MSETQTHEHGGKWVECADPACPDRAHYDAAGAPVARAVQVSAPEATTQPATAQSALRTACCFKGIEQNEPIRSGTTFFQCPFCAQAATYVWDGPRLVSSERAKSTGYKKRTFHLWIDLETMGLDEHAHPIVEVAAVLQDHQFREIWALDRIIARPDWRSAQSEVRAAHLQSGLVGESMLSQHSLADVENEMLHFLANNCMGPTGLNCNPKPDNIYLCGSSIHFDRRFIKQQMQRLEGFLHYRMLDVSAFYLATPQLMRRIPEPPKTHRAMADIRRSIALHQQIREITSFAFEFLDQQGSIRPAVLRFAARMEEVLKSHDDAKGKAGWAGVDRHRLFRACLEEAEELRLEILEAVPEGRKVLKECVDVANYAMMIADESIDLRIPLFHG